MSAKFPRGGEQDLFLARSLKRRHLIICLIRNICQDFFKTINRWLIQTLLLLTLFQQYTTGGQAGYTHTKMVRLSIITLNLL